MLRAAALHRPRSSDWLPDMTWTDLRLGRHRFDNRLLAGREGNALQGAEGEHNAVELEKSIAISANMPAG